MSIRDDIQPFTDINGYINPALVDVTKGRQCDNNMFTSEYFIMLQKTDQLTAGDYVKWAGLMRDCFEESGLLLRYPNSIGDQEGPDDHYALFAASKILNISTYAQDFLYYGWKHLGWYNTEVLNTYKNTQGTINWTAFQWRQPQMYFAAICAANKHRWYKFWNIPSMIIATATILFSSHGVDTITDLDARRLTYLLILTVEQDSILCRFAAKVWKRRLLSDYGDTGMREVYKRYMRDNHPFGIYSQQY